MEAATKACELTGWKNPECFDTLAAAYAEAGDFDGCRVGNASLAIHAPDGMAHRRFLERLALYRLRQPFRQLTSSP